MTRETHQRTGQPRQRPGIVMAMLASLLLVCTLLAPGARALAEEAPAADREEAAVDQAANDEAAWDAGRWSPGASDSGAWHEGPWDEGAWEQPAGPTLADLARKSGPDGTPPVVELRLQAAPVGLAVEVADGVHLGAAADYDHRTREAVALLALRLSL